MANRHLARSVVLQSLFEVDSGLEKNQSAEEALMRNISEFAPDQSIFSFMKQLFDLVLAKQEDLNKIIEKAAPEWPLEKIAIIDRNILRIGLAELLFGDPEQVPPKVAINEAIELAKEFGGESSGRFINGVLGAVYKELGEEPSNAAKKDPTTPKASHASHKIAKGTAKGDEIPLELLGGAFVYARDGEDIYVALEHDIFGHWTLPKGRVEEKEKVEDCIVREVKEEIGLDVKLVEEIGTNEYVSNDPNTKDGRLRKRVTYYLAESPYVDIKLEPGKSGLDDAQWFKMVDIVDLNFYDDVLPIITKAVNILASK